MLLMAAIKKQGSIVAWSQRGEKGKGGSGSALFYLHPFAQVQVQVDVCLVVLALLASLLS